MKLSVLSIVAACAALAAAQTRTATETYVQRKIDEAAAGLVTHVDLATATNAVKADLAAALKPTALYTSDGNTWTDATGCVWRIDFADCWRVEIEAGVRTNIVLRPPTGERDRWVGADRRQLYRSPDDGTFIYDYWWMGEFYLSAEEDERLLTAAGFRLVRFDEVTTNLVTRFATETDFATTIPATVTNVVRDVQGLVYDEKLGITWRQTMYDGNLYYVAITNANITEVE